MILVVGMLFPLKWMISFHLKPAHLFPDFFGLWSAGLYAIRHASAGVYDAASLQAFQHGFGMPADLSYPFSYPPWLLLVLAPLSILPWKAAMGVWLAVTFSAFVAALAPWRWPPVAMALVLLTPATAVCFLVGQNGFLTAALILGGLRLLWTRPVLAGALLASAAYKPQFAILLPFVLLFGGHWRAMIGGALAVVTLSLASTLAFGPEIWGAWLAGLHQNAASMMGGRAALLTLMPTVTSTVLLLGGDITLGPVGAGPRRAGRPVHRLAAAATARSRSSRRPGPGDPARRALRLRIRSAAGHRRRPGGSRRAGEIGPGIPPPRAYGAPRLRPGPGHRHGPRRRDDSGHADDFRPLPVGAGPHARTRRSAAATRNSSPGENSYA